MRRRPLRVAILLSTRYFEDFYGDGLGLSRAEYLESYRNDWSWDWCRMLIEQQVEPTLYVTTIESGQAVSTADGYAVRFLPLGALALPWVRFPTLERSPLGRYLGQAANAAAMLPALRHALARDEIDVLCVQEYWTARFDVLARALNWPVVAVDQGVPDRHEIKWLKRGAFRRSAGVVVQTAYEQAKVARYGGSARRIPNAVDCELFSPGVDDIPEASSVILSVGRLHDGQKRLSDVLRALALLPTAWRLQIVGTGPDGSSLEKLALQLGVSQRVEYLGFVPRGHQLRDLYRSAGVFVLPSAYEGLPMVLLEAMSCGAPVVGSDIPAIAEVLRHGEAGLTVPVGEPGRLAEAIATAMSRRRELGRAARAEILASYDQRVVGARLTQMLEVAGARATGP